MSKFQFLRKAAKFKAEIPVILDKMANNAVHQFKVTNFDSAGFVDGGVKKWSPNKVQDGRQQLVKTGRGRESIRTLVKTFYSRTVGTDVPYMGYHNEGTKHLPQRKIIGNSKELEMKNGKVIIEHLKRIV